MDEFEDVDTFSASLPIGPLRATLWHDETVSEPVLILHFFEDGDAIINLPDGKLQKVAIGFLKTDFRYSDEAHGWIDFSLAVAATQGSTGPSE